MRYPIKSLKSPNNQIPNTDESAVNGGWLFPRCSFRENGHTRDVHAALTALTTVSTYPEITSGYVLSPTATAVTSKNTRAVNRCRGCGRRRSRKSRSRSSTR